MNKETAEAAEESEGKEAERERIQERNDVLLDAEAGDDDDYMDEVEVVDIEDDDEEDFDLLQDEADSRRRGKSQIPNRQRGVASFLQLNARLGDKIPLKTQFLL